MPITGLKDSVNESALERLDGGEVLRAVSPTMHERLTRIFSICRVERVLRVYY